MAAGLGFKDFSTGEVLTAADVDGYLMQGIWVFASAAARNAAVTAPQEGNFAFTKDTNSLWYYDGAAWVASGATGDIEGVTAGTGISGGGTSGTVTITNSMATAIDAKGDLVVGTGADTFSRLAVGTNGHTLVADSAEATGLKWAAPAGGGKVLQVVSSTSTTSSSHNSATLTNTPLTVTITPTSATSKIYVTAFHSGAYIANFASGVTNVIGSFALTRNGTQRQAYGIGAESFPSSNNKIVYSPVLFSLLDDPATTSAVVYRTQSACVIGTAIVTGAAATQVDSIVAMEIGA